MGNLIFIKTQKPIRVYLYDNVENLQLVINSLTEYETGYRKIKSIEFYGYEIPILLKLLDEMRNKV